MKLLKRQYNLKKLNEKAKEILRLAEERGVEENFLFLTSFRRYVTQINILHDLEEVIENNETLVTKEYVKNRENIYVHPAIGEFVKTAGSADRTAALLLKIIENFQKDKDTEATADGFDEF